MSKISEESSSSTEEDEPPSSPELRKTKRSRFQRKTVNKSKGSGWTCGVCHSWFPERDEYVSHMKKDHGKVRRKLGATAPALSSTWKCGQGMFMAQSSGAGHLGSGLGWDHVLPQSKYYFSH